MEFVQKTLEEAMCHLKFSFLKKIIFGSLLLLLGGIFLAGCGGKVYRDFRYDPQEIDEAPQTQLSIAVIPFEENRKKVDEGSTNWAYVPLMPTAIEKFDAPQDESARNRAEYYYPDLLAYSLAVDLIHNNVGSVVHLNPAVTDHYDIVIRGSLDGMPVSKRKLTYGLGPAAFLTGMIGLPSGTNAIETMATYEIYQPGAPEPLYSAQHTGEYARPQWGGDELAFDDGKTMTKHYRTPYMHYLLQGFQEITENFIVQSAPVVSAVGAKSSDKTRRFRYYESLDPEVGQIKRALKNTSGVKKKSLAHEYKKRLKLLELYRQKEWEELIKQQVYRNETLAKRLTQIAQVRQQERTIRRNQFLAEESRREAQRKQFFGALAAGLQPALRHASSRNGANSETWGVMAKDVGSAMAAMPEAPPPVPDTMHLLDEINVDMTGLEGIGSDPFAKLKGATLQEVRQNFLRLYRSKTQNVRALL